MNESTNAVHPGGGATTLPSIERTVSGATASHTLPVELDDEEDEKRHCPSCSLPCCLHRLSFWALVASITFFLSGIAVVIINTKQQRQQTEATAAVADYSQVTQEYVGLRNELLEEPLLPTRAQVQALQWLALREHQHGQEPSSSSNSSMLALEQRFALAVIYFHWSGPLWNLHPSDGWPNLDADSVTHVMTGDNDTLVVSSVLSSDSGSLASTNAANDDECSWLGVTCNENRTIVTGLNLTDSAFEAVTGRIPSDLGRLSGLRTLVLANHHLKGCVLSAMLERLTNLEVVDLSNNRLTLGTTLADGLHRLTNMRYFSLGTNRLQGSFPIAAMANWSYLETIDLSMNPNMSASDFWNFVQDGSWPYLRVVKTSSTGIETHLPEGVLSSSNLQIIEADRTPMKGSLPSALGMLSQLETIALHSSGVSGSIPTELVLLTNLKILSLGLSAITGTLMADFQFLTSLEYLSLEYNTGLSGTIPSEWGLLSSLCFLSLASTMISGTVPSELGSPPNLVELLLSSTRLTGTMPNELCGLDFLEADCGESSQSGASIQCTCCTMCNYR